MNEIRVYDFSREHREMAPRVRDEEGSRVVEGYAIVFNQRSRVMYDKAARKTFIEIIEPRAVTREFLDQCDIKFLFNHDSDYILGRSIFGGGTLKYEIDEYGVRYSCEIPRTSQGDMVLEAIRRGDVFGCSFAFQYSPDGIVDSKKNAENIRTIIAFANISDFSVVVDPAYWGTYVTERAFVEPDHNDISNEFGGAFGADLEEELDNLQNM